VSNRTNPEVDAWFEAEERTSSDAMQSARRIILDSDTRVTETIKWSTPTFVYKGNILSFTPTKTGVGLMFHRGAEIPGDHPLMTGEGKLVRTMRFSGVDETEESSDDIRRAVVAWCDWRDATD